VTTKAVIEGQLKKERLLNRITHQLHDARDLDEILLYLKDEIIALFDAERITVYGVDTEKREIFSKIKEGDEVKEIRLNLEKTSVAGHTAVSGKTFNIADVYDSDELKKLDADLKFDEHWDQISGFKTRQLLSGPILYNKYLKGVLEVINKVGADRFSPEDEQYMGEICKVLGLTFHNQSRIQRQPTKFDYLLTQQIISEDDLNKAIARAREQKGDLPTVLVNDFNLSKKALAKSFEAYYGVPFVFYEDRIIIPSELVRGLNLGYLKRNFWVPMQKENGKMIILIDDPHNAERVKEIKNLMPAEEYEFRVALREDILHFIDSALGDEAEATSVSTILGELEGEHGYREEDEDELLNESDAGIVRLANQLIKDAHDQGSSDIHIEPYFGKHQVRPDSVAADDPPECRDRG